MLHLLAYQFLAAAAQDTDCDSGACASANGGEDKPTPPINVQEDPVNTGFFLHKLHDFEFTQEWFEKSVCYVTLAVLTGLLLKYLICYFADTTERFVSDQQNKDIKKSKASKTDVHDKNNVNKGKQRAQQRGKSLSLGNDKKVTTERAHRRKGQSNQVNQPKQGWW